jgi:sugar/nucleoside kinase (ribokinase family)
LLRGSVGANGFGLFLKKTIEDVGLDTSYMKLLEKQNTTLEINLHLLILIKI